jgi:membrane fusion protein (multidrug efflux system)
MTEVKQGLKPGERIVASGLLRLRAGQPVQIKQKDTPANSIGVE